MFQPEPEVTDSDLRIIERTAAVLADGHGRTMQEIADRSGIGRTTLYRRFHTREDLLHAIFAQAIAEALDGIAAAEPETGNAREALERVVDQLLNVGDKYRVLFQERSSSPDAMEGKAALAAALRAPIERAQRDGLVDPALQMEWVLGVLGTLVSTATRLIGSGELARNHAAGLVTRTFLGGVRAPKFDSVS